MCERIDALVGVFLRVCVMARVWRSFALAPKMRQRTQMPEIRLLSIPW